MCGGVGGAGGGPGGAGHAGAADRTNMQKKKPAENPQQEGGQQDEMSKIMADFSKYLQKGGTPQSG